jgi:hypothetical protein
MKYRVNKMKEMRVNSGDKVVQWSLKGKKSQEEIKHEYSYGNINERKVYSIFLEN